MKKTYFNPEAIVLAIASEDILTTSPLSLSNGDGFQDNASFGEMFGA